MLLFLDFQISEKTSVLEVRTDASEYGKGAILLQEHDKMYPIAYASRKLNERQREAIQWLKNSA